MNRALSIPLIKTRLLAFGCSARNAACVSRALNGKRPIHRVLHGLACRNGNGIPAGLGGVLNWMDQWERRSGGGSDDGLVEQDANSCSSHWLVRPAHS